MSDTNTLADKVVDRGEAIYARDLQALMEPEHIGKFLVIDVESGDYALDVDELTAMRIMRERRPGSLRYLKRIGFSYAHRLGGQLRPQSS